MSQTPPERPLPMWVRIAAVFIPILVLVIGHFLTNTPKESKADTPPPPTASTYRLIGQAYYRGGQIPIANATVRLVGLTAPATFTGKDGIFILENIPLKAEARRVQLSIQLPDAAEETVQLIQLQPENDSREIELGRVVFDLTPATERTSAAPTPSTKKITGNTRREPAELPLYQVRIIYPDRLVDPDISIQPPARKVDRGLPSCVASVTPGEYAVTISAEGEVWKARFTHDQAVLSAAKFTKLK